MDKQFAYIFFGIEFLGLVSIILGSLFLVGFSGGLDLIGYDFPGYSETIFMLQIVFPLTAFFYATSSKLKNQTLASLLLLLVLISNIVLAVQVARVLRELIGWFL